MAVCSAAYTAPHPCLSCAVIQTRVPVASASLLIDSSQFRGSPSHRLGDSTGSGAPAASSFPSAAVIGRREVQSARGGNLVVCLSSNTLEVITASAWEVSVLQSDVPVLVEFWASWCGPCRMVGRLLDEIAKEYAGRIRLYILNTDDYPNVAASHNINRVPTVLLFKNGEKVKSLTGTLPKSVYVDAIEQLLSHR